MREDNDFRQSRYRFFSVVTRTRACFRALARKSHAKATAHKRNGKVRVRTTCYTHTVQLGICVVLHGRQSALQLARGLAVGERGVLAGDWDTDGSMLTGASNGRQTPQGSCTSPNKVLALFLQAKVCGGSSSGHLVALPSTVKLKHLDRLASWHALNGFVAADGTRTNCRFAISGV